MARIKTNEQSLRALIKSFNMLEAAIFAERVMKISALTKQALEQDATQFEGLVSNPQIYSDMCAKIDEHFPPSD